MALRATHRDAGQSTVVDLSGKITLGEGSALLRKTVRGLLDDKRTHIVLNLADVDYIDLLQLTKLYTVFDVYTEESAALSSFQ